MTLTHTHRLLQLAVLASLFAAPINPVFATSLQVQVTDANGKPLADTVVFLDSATARAASKPLRGVEIAQEAKQFIPQVSVVTVGTAVSFPNRDTVRHHVYSFSPIKVFEIKLYVGTPADPVVFDKPGVAILGCNIHDRMTAWTVVVETPWFGKTDADGKLRINDVAPGNYSLRSWHANLPVGAPAQQQAVTIATRGNVAAAVRLVGTTP